MMPEAAAGQTEIVDYYHLDTPGAVRAVTKPAGQAVARLDFLPFGEAWNPQATAKQKKLFTGKERDTETGLDYFGARYYRPQVARFTTVDPAMTLDENLTDPQRWNRYAYVRNNALKFTDRDGRDCIASAKHSDQQTEGHRSVTRAPRLLDDMPVAIAWSAARR